MTEEEIRCERSLALDAFQEAWEEQKACKARVGRVFQRLDAVISAHRKGVLRSEDGRALLISVAGRVAISGVSYPDEAEIAGALSSLENAEERVSAARRQAAQAVGNREAMRTFSRPP